MDGEKKLYRVMTEVAKSGVLAGQEIPVLCSVDVVKITKAYVFVNRMSQMTEYRTRLDRARVESEHSSYGYTPVDAWRKFEAKTRESFSNAMKRSELESLWLAHAKHEIHVLEPVPVGDVHEGS